jgi:2-polyprenyl-3-methyl-5-hydroxy-6-metoxy-1,4-benzoquinol methylase
MCASSYYERIWETVPQGASPPGLGLRREFVLERAGVLASGQQPLRVLDVGCGEGELTRALADAGHDPLGIDVCEEPLRRARALNPDLELLEVSPQGPWPLADSTFDLVWAGETIEHVLDTIAWLSEVRRVLRSGGMLALTTPDHGPITRLGLALSPRAFDAHFDPRGDHLRFYSRRSLRSLLSEFRFQEIAIAASGGLPGARRVLLASAVRSRY